RNDRIAPDAVSASSAAGRAAERANGVGDELNFGFPVMNGKESAMAKMVIVATRLDANEELAAALRGAGHEVSRAGAMSQVQGADVVFAEPALFAAAPAAPAPDVPVVVTAAPEQVASAIDALRLGGAYDLL